MRTLEEITDEAIARVDPKTEARGYLTRQDLFDFIDIVGKENATKEAIRGFLDTLPFYTEANKKMVLDDLPTYGL